MPARLDSVSTTRVDVLKALAHPSRLLITESLMHGELCVSEIRDLVGDDVSTVSKHLAILKTAGVLSSEKRGLNVYYHIACDCFGEFLKCIDQVCPPPSGSRPEASQCC
jgi:ArsR family transcriptional regulator